MQQPFEKNKKVQTDKQFDDNEVREGQPNSLHDTKNKSANSYKHSDDKQHKSREEYIDRNGETKDKS